MYVFNPLTINLHGLHLIEASAGTGKTYTLTTLYLRLLLEGSLNPRTILVVTFTKAATEALRERVRSRVVEALTQLEYPNKKKPDPELIQLLNYVPNPAAAKAILTTALAHMDEAAIYTIHSFCQRMLQDYAFESGVSFEAELITDETKVLRTAAADVWRKRLAAASMEETAWIISQWSHPWELLSAIQSTLYKDDLRVLPQLNAHEVQQEVAKVLTILNHIRTAWPQARETCIDVLADNSNLHKAYYKKAKVLEAVAAMDVLATERHLPKIWPKCIELFQAETLLQRTLKHKITPQHSFFNLCDNIDKARVERANQQWRALWLQQARQQIQELLDQAKHEQELLSFDDLLKNLDTALANANTADTLATIIRTRFPVALIDEFQDTDPKQYRIFRHIYEHCPKCGMFLIGDPKQAIYAFRGADVFTYMQARADAVSQQAEHTLGTNWRSNSRLVAAVNTIFANAPQPFLYANIPFHQVAASPKADTKVFTVHGNLLAPLQLWIMAPQADKNVVTVAVANVAAACACAEYIAELLQAADAGHAKIGTKPIRSKDIAVLVRSHREGVQMQKALNACNVGCVTLSQDSIFTTEQAEELSMVLTAVVKYEDTGLLRAALATTLLGWNAEQLESLSHDENAVTALIERFQEYHRLWLERSFIVAFQHLLIREGIPQRLLRLWDGERWLTNVLQLAELLQEAALQCVGADGLLLWLDLQRHTEQEVDETRQMRLESDESLVQVVTMHKSKGLEYPIVFIPFPWSLKPHRNSQVLFHDVADFTLCLDLGTDNQEAHQCLQKKEDLAEQIRLFYVAITRAAQLCVLCWGPVNQAETSAPALLLHPDRNTNEPSSCLKSLNIAGVRAELETLASKAPACIEVRDLPAPTGIRWQGSKFDPLLLHAAKFTGTIDNRWIVASYSGLTRGDESLRPDHDTAVVEDAQPVVTTVDSTSVDQIFAFPAGAEAGLFLHSILERLDFTKATHETLYAATQDLLPSYDSLRHNPPPNADNWGAVAVEIITNCLDTPLITLTPNSEMIRLRDISWNNRLSELEFNYPINNLTPTNLQSVLASFPEYSDSALGLQFKPCEGLMHGFIDLIFRHRHRYYLADYKSNRLGMNIANYNYAGMHQAMRTHHYDLQYLIYTVAVHRFLQQRLPNYDYEQHFGGVFYLFLRGMRPQLGADYGVYFDRPKFEVVKKLCGLFQTY